MTPLILIASYFLAIFFSIFLLVYVRKAKLKTRFLFALIALFTALNITQLSIILIGHNDTFTVKLLGRLFYALLAFHGSVFFSYAIKVSSAKVSDLVHQIENGLWLTAFCIAVLSLLTDEIVKGFIPFSFTLTTVEGDNYWVALVHGFLASIAAVFILAQDWLKLRYEVHRGRSTLLLLAYAVHIFSLMFVVVLLRYGIEINVLMVYPYSSTFCLALVVYGEHKYRLNTTHSVSTKQNEKTAYDQLVSIFTKYSEGTYTFNETSEKLDHLLITYQYDKHNGNIMQTAKAMGLGRSTLYKKMQKHKIK